MNLLCLFLSVVFSLPPPNNIAPSFQDNYRMGFTSPERIAIEELDTPKVSSSLSDSRYTPEIAYAELSAASVVGISMLVIAGIAVVAFGVKRWSQRNNRPQNDQV